MQLSPIVVDRVIPSQAPPELVRPYEIAQGMMTIAWRCQRPPLVLTPNAMPVGKTSASIGRCGISDSATEPKSALQLNWRAGRS